MHRMPAYERYVRAFDRFDQAEGWADRLLCLPCHAALTEEDLGVVVDTIAEVVREE